MAKAKKLATKMKSTIKKRNDPVFARKFVTYGVIVSSVMVALSLFVAVCFNPEAIAKRKFEFLAREYYETYYYEKFFEKTGFQPVPLRQLLLYKNGKNSGFKKYFEAGNFSCDKNTTTAKFYPEKPYGVKDYRVEFTFNCTDE